MEDKESLETGALISQFPDPVQTEVHNLLTHGVVTTSVVVGGVFLKGEIGWGKLRFEQNMSS